MLSPLDFLSDLINPLLSFLPKALLVAMAVSYTHLTLPTTPYV